MLPSEPSSTGISGKEAASSLPRGPPQSAQNQMVQKDHDRHGTSCGCNERKRKGSADHRRESGHNGEHCCGGSEIGDLTLGESVGAVKGRDVAGIAPQQPINDTLHGQILAPQANLQKVEAEKAELLKQERLEAQQKIQILHGKLHQAATENSQTRQQLEAANLDLLERARLDAERKQLVGRLATQEKQIAGLQRELNKGNTEMKQHFEGKIRTLEDNLRRADIRHSQTSQLLDLRSAELRSAEVFLNKADSFAREDLVTKLVTLNSQILNAAATMADSLIIARPTVDPKIFTWLEGTIGSRMFSILATRRRDPHLLELTLQHYMITWCTSIMSSFCSYTKEDGFLREIYEKIQALGDQGVAGRWRAMTCAQLTPAIPTEMENHLVIILRACGWNPEDPRSEPAMERVHGFATSIEEAAVQLRRAIMEGFTSADVLPYYVTPDTPFDPPEMNDLYGKAKKGEPVLCTTDIGLRSFVIERSKKGAVRHQSETFLKAKVVVVSGVDTSGPEA